MTPFLTMGIMVGYIICLVIKKYIIEEKNKRTKDVKIFFL